MPIYEYRCQSCGEKFDKLVRSLSNEQAVTCSHCGSEQVEKAISLFGSIGGSGRLPEPAPCSTGPT